MHIFSQEYISGITEGREFLKDNPGLTPQEMRRLMSNCQDLVGQGFAQSLKDTFRGERDFWKGQLRKS